MRKKAINNESVTAKLNHTEREIHVHYLQIFLTTGWSCRTKTHLCTLIHLYFLLIMEPVKYKPVLNGDLTDKRSLEEKTIYLQI